jgi:hypothetical protein
MLNVIFITRPLASETRSLLSLACMTCDALRELGSIPFKLQFHLVKSDIPRNDSYAPIPNLTWSSVAVAAAFGLVEHCRTLYKAQELELHATTLLDSPELIAEHVTSFDRSGKFVFVASSSYGCSLYNTNNQNRLKTARR